MWERLRFMISRGVLLWLCKCGGTASEHRPVSNDRRTASSLHTSLKLIVSRDTGTDLYNYGVVC